MKNQTKEQLEALKGKYEERIKVIENKIEKIKTPIGFQYKNRKA